MNRFIFSACISTLLLCNGCKNKEPAAAKEVKPASAPVPAPQVVAPTPPVTQPPPEFVSHLQAGRKFEQARQWTQAVSEFEAALKAFPDEPRALSDLGWSAFRSGDLDKAKKANDGALAHSTTPQQKGAILYNMGRVAEAQKDFDAAIGFYTKSIEARPNSEVQKRMNGLATHNDPTTAALGPFASLKAMCPELKKSESRLDIDDQDHDEPLKFDFTCSNEELKRISSGLPAPIAEVVFFTSTAFATNHPGRNHSSNGNVTQVFLNVGVRIGSKWHLLADVEHGLGDGGIQILDAAVKPVGANGAKLLVVRMSVGTSLSSMFHSSHESTTVIGVGPSGTPSSLDPVQTLSLDGESPYGEDATDTESETRRDIRFENGALVVYRLTEIADRLAKRKKKKVTEMNERYMLTFE